MILTICTGNICRSPVAEHAFKRELPNLNVASAGLHAVVSADIDPEARIAAEILGLQLPKHNARQLETNMVLEAKIIFVMESHHRDEISRKFPFAMGKTFLLGGLGEDKEIPDPYRMGKAAHLNSVEKILKCVHSWAPKINTII